MKYLDITNIYGAILHKNCINSVNSYSILLIFFSITIITMYGNIESVSNKNICP